MKKILYLIVLVATLTITTQSTQAQAWEKSTKLLGIGFGASTFFHIDGSASAYYGNFYSPLTGQLNFQGEFGVHDYVGIGFTTGVGGRAGYYRSYGYLGYYGSYGSAGEINVPVGILANFHFYQLIADKTGKDIHADKLDIYAGLNVGGGIAAVFYSTETRIVPIAFGGVQAGARYYFKDNIGVNVEVGFPKLVHAGMVFKL